MNVAHLLTRQACERPAGIALIEGAGPGARKITFAELNARSARTALRLTRDGVSVGEHVLIFVPMSIDLYVALVAVFRCGAVATFLDPSAGMAHVAHCCEIAKPGAFVGTPKSHLLRLTSAALRGIRHQYAFERFVPFARRLTGGDEGGSMPEAAIVERSDADPALLTFTSGSTGRPKAAVRSHGFLTAQHAALTDAIDLQLGEVDLATLPIFALANIASGVTTLIADGDLRRPGFVDPTPILRQATLEGATRSTASPAFFERLLDGVEPSSAMASFRRVYTGGAPVFPGLLERMQRAMPNARVYAIYGSTEAEPIAHVAWDEIAHDDIAAMFAGAGLLAGPPVPQVQLRIIPNTWGRPIAPLTAGAFDAMSLPPGEVGEIVVHGDHVLSGYLNGDGDEQTKFRVDGGVWHRTGDAGYVDPRGRLWLMGRAEARVTDDRGVIYPFAVECAASRIEGVRRSALLSHEGRRLLVVELTTGGKRFDAEGVRAMLAWARIDEILPLPRIPVDKRHNAKIDYPKLRQLVAELRPV